jgi:hypothetical protein
MVPEAENAEAGRLQRFGAIRVIVCLLQMLPSIDFDDKFVFQADKIKDIVAKWI